ncbi:hypothetical protein ABIF65_004260 [Bradyrhizobium japonicum]|jgi:hypothetical protein|nr:MULTISPECIES: hypothetical protein [Bradyrhizobium]MBR0883049.1 hypothetical protein [Bradyrhizobium liaoningense]MBR0946684.1 hypothetical protein [Bradyrhizobium liaoningense]MBR0999993.1 hypothetical protein [Bradyrhizobium liaoningense]MBR1069333.1 hypothetical protein [Bradyrhizobium liaoningense]MCP1742575.1 hypothetical protein [Bradyrhizobium japonicum]
MMTTDRELLELAAKAIGLNLRYNYLGGRDANQPWDPLTDDGDRYRLIRDLGMSICFKECTIYKRQINGDLIQEWWGGDCGDEEHAVLRAAAEIGRSTS